MKLIVDYDTIIDLGYHPTDNDDIYKLGSKIAEKYEDRWIIDVRDHKTFNKLKPHNNIGILIDEEIEKSWIRECIGRLKSDKKRTEFLLNKDKYIKDSVISFYTKSLKTYKMNKDEFISWYSDLEIHYIIDYIRYSEIMEEIKDEVRENERRKRDNR
jgi:hypothetical protein